MVGQLSSKKVIAWVFGHIFGIDGLYLGAFSL